LLLFRNVKHSNALVNLRVGLQAFLIVFLCPCSVPRVGLCVH